MEEKKPGKRLAVGATKSPGAKRGLIIVGAVAAALAAAYVALCAWVGTTSGNPLPGTTVAGVDIGGLSFPQAQEKLEQEFSRRAQSLSLTVAGDSQAYPIPIGAVEADVLQAVTDADSWPRAHGFFAQGAYFLKSLIVGHDVEVSVGFTATGEAQVDDILAGIESELGGVVQETTWSVEGDELVFHLGKPGRAFDLSTVKSGILAHFSSGDTTPLELTAETTDPAAVDLEQVHSEVCTEVSNASLDPETFEITPSVTGLDFEISTASAALEGAAWGSDVSVPLAVTEPTVSTESLRDLLFRDVLGSATSKVGGSANRKSNVALAASTFNGRILLPGEVFSYNTSTGSRTAEKGYKMAPVYKGGKSVDEIGGGICQPSSTLYLATLNSNLKIVERHHHTYAVGYVPDGMDATVYYGSLDYRFENDTDYPIKLVSESYQKGGATYLTVTIYGTKLDDLAVKMTNNVYNWVSYETVYQVDASVPAGTVKEGQNGYTGRNADTYRNLYDGDGNLVSSTLETTNKYKVRERILLVNPADANQYGLNADGTPYTPPAAPPTPAATPTPSASTAPAPETSAPVTDAPAVTETPSPAESAAPSAEPSDTPTADPTPAVPDIGIPIVSAAPSEESGGQAEGGAA